MTMGRTDIARKYMGAQRPRRCRRSARDRQPSGSERRVVLRDLACRLGRVASVAVDALRDALAVSVGPGAPPTCSRTSAAQPRERSASLLLASAVASPALWAIGAALSAATATSSAALAENSRTVGAGLLGEVSTATRI